MSKDNPSNPEYCAPLPYEFWIEEVGSVLKAENMTVEEALGAVLHFHGLSRKSGLYKLSEEELNELRCEVLNRKYPKN